MLQLTFLAAFDPMERGREMTHAIMSAPRDVFNARGVHVHRRHVQHAGICQGRQAAIPQRVLVVTMPVFKRLDVRKHAAVQTPFNTVDTRYFL